MIGYPLEQLREEVAFVAYYFHWDFETIMNMEHAERKSWCEEISKINNNLNSDEKPKEVSLSEWRHNDN